jgi:hypothetical protein
MLRPQNMQKSLVWCALLALPAASGLAQPAQAATFTNTTIDFSESAFPASAAAITGTQAYNLLDDATGTKLSANNGDANDIAITFANSGAGTLSSTGTPKLAINGNLISTRGYQKTVGVNNPGTLVSTTATLQFLPQWNITDLQAKFSSLNTAAIAWEYSLIGFLKPDGTPFTAAPAIGSYGSATSLTGSPSQGWYWAASKDTVTGVAVTGVVSNVTAKGSNGSKDTLNLTYALAGLDPNTPVGGLIWTTWLEDVRGVQNVGSDLTASLASFTFSGSSTNAVSDTVPTPALLPGLVALAAGARRRWKAAQ